MKKTGFLTLFAIVIFGFSQSAIAQFIKVSGTVTDEKGNIIRKQGAVVVFPFTFGGNIADIKNGRYAIYVDNDGELVFDIRGYFPQKIKVNNRTTIDVVLEKDNRLILTIQVKVTDENKNPLNNVRIIPERHLKELESVVSFKTQEDGTCIFVTAEDKILTFSLEGYETQSVAVDKRDEINVVMKKLKE